VRRGRLLFRNKNSLLNWNLIFPLLPGSSANFSFSSLIDLSPDKEIQVFQIFKYSNLTHGQRSSKPVMILLFLSELLNSK
jgi:hypothetical protein